METAQLFSDEPYRSAVIDTFTLRQRSVESIPLASSAPEEGLEALRRQLADTLAALDVRVLLVSPHVLRRVIRHCSNLGDLPLQTPHHRSFVVPSAALLQLVSRKDLDLDGERPLGQSAILLVRPSRADADRPPEELKLEYWRLLFHARVHAELEEAYRQGTLDDDQIALRIDEIGSDRFSEMCEVLEAERQMAPCDQGSMEILLPGHPCPTPSPRASAWTPSRRRPRLPESPRPQAASFSAVGASSA